MRMLAGAVLLSIVAVDLQGQSAPASDRDVHWREDVRFLARELPARHRNAFAYVDRNTFDRAASRLDSAIPQLTDAQVRLRIAGLAALLRDGHTSAPLPTYSLRLPVTVLWLDDGVFIVNATKDYASLIGARITRLQGRDIAEVHDSLSQYITHETESWFQVRAGELLLRPMALRDAGVGGDSTSATLEVSQNGVVRTVTLPAVPSEGFMVPPRTAVPLYRERAGEKYWWQWLPDDATVFVKYNRCVDPDDFKRMSDSVMKAIDELHPLRVVVDIRDNTGGNSVVVQPLIEALRRRDDVNRKDALYVVIGRLTFSSGLLAAYDFRNKTRATLVGEPTGERPNSYGEVKTFELPNSHIHVSYSTKYFHLVRGDPAALFPDVSAPPTADAYINGRDPAMEWILGHSRTARR